jgi:GntR family transcriptional regulator
MGTLRPGDQLPTVKQVVAEVTVNPNTVTKAYRELEHAGLAEGRQGVGTFVLRRPQGPPPKEQARLARGLQRWIETARAAGLDSQAMEAMLRSLLGNASDRGVA